MTFPEFVLNLRRRLQDRYTNSGTIITTADTDGVRWTSSELVDICNVAFQEIARYILIYKETPLFKNLFGNFVAYDSTTLVSGILTFPSPSSVFKILSISKGSEDDIYGEISSSKFTDYVAQDKQPRKEGLFFAEFFNTTSKVKYVKALPADNSDVHYSYLYYKADYSATDISGATALHIVGLDDLLLDIAEREARDREHNWDRSNALDKRIFLKIGVSING